MSSKEEQKLQKIETNTWGEGTKPPVEQKIKHMLRASGVETELPERCIRRRGRGFS